jgi:D-alanine transaminase
MEITYFNGKYIPKDEVKISPDDRGFLFGDGIYEVVKWYGGEFYDIEGHIRRLKRSLDAVRISWKGSDDLKKIAEELVTSNRLDNRHAMIYLQVTRGASPRSHSFPGPGVSPTVYSFVKELPLSSKDHESGARVMMRKDIRWSRCDIKSIALLANVLSFQEAVEQGYKECIFTRDGVITEGAHSNVFFVVNGTLFTHPQTGNILPGITRNNILRIAEEAGIPVREEPVGEQRISTVQEAFITSTTLEVIPVTAFDRIPVGSGVPGPVTRIIQERFRIETEALKRK